MEHGVDFLHSILLLLVLSVGAIATFRLFNLTPILGYLLVGAITSPYALGWLPDNEAIHFLGEVGVVFLLFAIGLEFSLKQLLAMRTTVLGLGGAQVIVSTLGGVLILTWFDMSWQGAIIAAGAMAMSSTAIVVKQLNEQGEMRVRHGQLAISILLFQDIAVVPFLIVIPLLAGDASLQNSDPVSLTLNIMVSSGMLAMAFVMGHYALRPLFHYISRGQSVELFNITVLLVALTAAWVTQSLGLSLALGAFLAGMMLSETEYKHQIESEIRPFRDILMGLFFITVGAKLNLAILPGLWLPILLLVLGLTVGKALLIAVLARFFKADNGTALRTGLVLAQGGEFGFALLAIALSNGLLTNNEMQATLAAIVISMALSPIIIRYNDTVTKKLFADTYLRQRYKEAHNFSLEVKEIEEHVIICGYRRVGQGLGRLLRSQNIPYIALDLDPQIIHNAWEAGETVYYADATRPEVLIAAGLYRARMLVITTGEIDLSRLITQAARKKKQDIPILVRTRDDSAMEELEQLGANEVMPESLEASVMVSERVLARLGVPAGEIFELMERIRGDGYRSMQSFFHGQKQSSSHTTEAYLQTITLEHEDYALGRAIRELGLEKYDIKIKAIRRGGIRGDAPDNNMRLQSGDSLILEGKRDHLEKSIKSIKQGPKTAKKTSDTDGSSKINTEKSATTDT